MVRNAVAAASITCSRAFSVVQNRPRGSTTWSVASTAKFNGRTWIGSLPSTSARPPLVHHTANIVLSHRSAADRPLHVEQPRLRLAAGQVDGDRAQPHVRHVLGLSDARSDRSLRGLQIGDVTAVQPPALLPAKAEHPQRAVGFRPSDQAGDLGGADIDHAERAGTVMPWRLRLRRPGLGGRQNATRIIGHPLVLLRRFLRDHGDRRRVCFGRCGRYHRASFASILGRNTRRSGSRISMAASGRSSTACCC